MQFLDNELFHIYNRGNNKQPIFFNTNNYLFFLYKVRRFIHPHCEILNYCLMPNHFHFLIYADVRTIQTKKVGNHEKNVLSEGFKSLLSSYAQAINKQNNTTGSLFQQNTKAVCLRDGSENYAPVCFHYIHQNPLKARLVSKMENWDYSSFKDFTGERKGTLCNMHLAYRLLDLNPATFYKDSYGVINDSQIDNIFDD